MLWERQIGRLNASSPAYYKHRLYIVNLVPGHIVKLDAKTGKVLWKRPLPGRAESSPLVLDRTVYFGCEDGDLYALSTGNGNIRWTTQLGGPVKSAPAYHDGVALRRRLRRLHERGRRQDRQAEVAERLARARVRRLGQFYSTPAVAFGRVYAGNNDGRVYSFDERTAPSPGPTRPAATSTPGRPSPTPSTAAPTVYIGSFDGNIYALDAKNGETRWQRSAGRPGRRLALGGRRHRLRRRVQQRADQRLRR